MKKSLFELTIEEFTRVICDCQEVYNVSMKYVNDEGGKQEDKIRGTYDQIMDVAVLSKCEWLIKYTKENLFDYDIYIDELEIYNYLDEKTNHFEHERAKIVLRQMECFHDMYVDEERLQIINDKIKDGWEGYKMRKGKRLDVDKKRLVEDEKTEVIDYKDAYDKVFGIDYDFFYYTAIGLLKRKISLNTEGHTQGTLNKIKENERDSLPVELRSVEAGKLLGKLIQNKFCDDKYDWKRSKILLAYFASKASDTLELSNRMAGARKAVSWKPFESLFTIKGKKINHLAQAYRDLQNMGKADGQEDIDRLF